MYENFIQDRIAQLRQAKGVSARDMSLSLGQNKNYINQIENKKMLPSMQGFLYILEYFKITPKDFFDVDNANPEIINEFLSILKRLEKDDIEQLMNLANKFVK